jgi:hypothetical protein
MQNFVRRTTFPFLRLLGDESLCNVFLLLFMVIWVPIFATPFRSAVLMLWHAFLFLELMFFPPFFFLLGGLLVSTGFSCKNVLLSYSHSGVQIVKK